MGEAITVLHVDDDRAFLDLASRFLEREYESISVETTTSVDAALDRLADGGIDCVVSDLEMPGMGGLAFLEAVRAEHPDLPFVLFTGKGSEEVASKAITAGVTDYLQKGSGTDQYVVLANRIENVVSQRRAERSLTESESRFRALIEHSHDLITILDEQGTFMYVSPAIEHFLGYAPEELTGETAFEFVHPDDCEKVIQTFSKAIEDPTLTPEVECRLEHADGSWLITHSIGNNRFDDPVIEGLIVNTRDVTERRHTDHELAEAKATIEALYDVAARMETCTTTEELYRLAVEAAERILEFDLCIVDEVDGDVLVPQAVSSGVPEEAYYDTTPIDQEENLASETYRERESFVVGDLRTAGYAPAKSTYRSAISIPVGDHGVFQTVSETPHAFDDTDRDAAELLVAHLTASLDRVERETVLRTLQEELDRIRQADDPAEICKIAVEAARDVLGVPLCGVYLLDGAGEALEPTAVTPEVEALFDGPVPSYTKTDPIVWETFDDGEPRVVPDVEARGDRPNPGTSIRTLAVFPLGDLGVMMLSSQTPDSFEVTDVHFAKLLAAGTESTLIRAHRERELAEHEARLERERRRLTALFENATDAIVFAEFVDGEPIVLDANRAFEETFGYDADEIVRESVDELIVPPEDAEEASEITRRGHHGEDFEVEVRRVAADGPRDFLLRSVPVEANGDSTTGYGVYTDITERAEREAELQRQNERLEEFASVVSHDLRNPLTVAQGRLELAAETGDPVHHEKVADALDRMTRIIDDLLALAREGRTVGETSAVDLETVARRGWGSVDSGTATLVVDDLGAVAADAGRLQGLFENLFRNAVEHGGEDVTVRVGMISDGFYVEDDGPGIPADDRESVFEFGHSTADEGTGFGLAIVRQIAEAHGWTVSVGVGVSGGARFEVRGVEFV